MAITLDGTNGINSPDIIVISPLAFGYGTGAGGSVTQTTSKGAPVTLNKPVGIIVVNNSTLGAGAVAQFTFNNTFFSLNDLLLLANNSGNYEVQVSAVGNGFAVIRITNITAGSLSEIFSVSFAIIKGATA